MAFDIFLSYSHADKIFVDRLAHGMKALGFKVFRDSTSLGVYEKLDTTLKRSIADSKYVCAVISPTYLKSYWCLFEAIEAVKDQDLELKFLPLVLSHNPEDQKLDEQFILAALADIRNQRQLLEADIIAHKAFALYEKLEKLSFVQDYLPKIFTSIQNRIYPQFNLWDDASVEKNLMEFFEFLAPGRSALAASATQSVGGERNQVATKIRPQIAPLPIILWSKFVGVQAWRNKPIVSGPRVYVSSSGENWNARDEKDGVYCLDLDTGATIWHFHTEGDANEMLLSKGLIVVGTDEGQLYALNAQSGELVWRNSYDSSIVSGPIRLPMSHMSSQGRWLAGNLGEPEPISDRGTFVLYSGQVCTFDLDTGAMVEKTELGRKVTGRMSVCVGLGFTGSIILVPQVGGFLTELRVTDSGKIFDTSKTVDLGKEINSSDIASIKELVSVVDIGRHLVVGFARDTYSNTLPISVISRKTLKPNRKEITLSDSAGNLRADPLFIGSEIVIAPAYSDGLIFVDTKTQAVKELSLGNTLFEQWSSPIAGKNSLYLGRIDGFFHKIDPIDKKLVRSIYLGHHARSGTVYRGKERFSEMNDRASWGAGTSNAIFSTPVLSDDRVLVGTSEGYLYCIANL